jgi:sortase (surface protein transpeptidase)
MNDRVPRLVRGAGVIAMLAALAVLTGRVAITPGPSRPNGAAPPHAPRASAGQPARTGSAHSDQPVLPRSEPVRVSIPAIGAVSSLMPLGLNPDRTIQVPPLSNPMQAGWYSLGPTPGEVGSSVILGHVDGYSEPGIFFRLRELKPGDRVLVAREDGTTARFVVYRTEQVPKDDFPAEKVYGGTARPELRLITCGGTFDRESGNYRDNLIVSAALTAST